MKASRNVFFTLVVASALVGLLVQQLASANHAVFVPLRAGPGLSASSRLQSRPQAASPREVHLWVARDVAPGPRVRLTINTRNVPAVRLAAHRLEGVHWLIRRSEWQGDPPEAIRPVGGVRRPAATGKPAREWEAALATRAERQNPVQADRYRSREVALPPLPPGVYLLTARGGGKEAWAIVNVTHLAVVVKRAPRQLLAWVTDHATGALLPGARVALYTKEARRLAAGTTRADGTALLATAPGQEETVIVQRGSDIAAVPTAMEDPDGILKLHFQTDRPIYRPGHTVHFKAILRRTAGQGYTPVAETECRIEARDPKDNLLHQGTARTNALGTLSGRVELPTEGVPGPHTVAITVGDQTAYGTFSVAEYRKPEFKVTVRPAQARYLAGETAAFQVEAAYYFGAPLPQAEVAFQVRRADAPYTERDPEDETAGGTREAGRWFAGGDGNLYARDTYQADPFVAEGKVYTDEAGRVTIPIKTDRNAPDSLYRIQCTVRDASQRQVEAGGGVPVYAAALRLGIRSDLLLAPLGSVIPVGLRAVDLDGGPRAAPVTLSVRQPVWMEKQGRYRFRELTRTQVEVPASGRAAGSVPALAPGELWVRATAPDGSGRTAIAEFSLWIAAPGAKPAREPRQPSLFIRLDRRRYRPGETAKVWVMSNTHDRPILVTAEGGDLWQHLVVPQAKGGAGGWAGGCPRSGRRSWNLKTSRAMAPNAFVGASQWTRWHLLSASALLPLPDPTRRLQVKLEPDRDRYQPGDAATYRVRTADAAGRPVPAEVAVAVVDEAIFALKPDATPDPFTFYWGRRENLVLTAFSAPEELSGGAYQRNQPLAPVRERFLDTAFWDAHVATGPDGTARVTFEFPGNLTGWRATARAVTAETRVGATIASVQVSRPVMLRLAVPRLIVQGDRLTLIGTVHNRTGQEREFEARLTGEAIRIAGEAIRRVRVPAGGEGRIEWPLAAETLPEDGNARLLGEVVATDDPRAEFADALRVPLRIVPRGIAERLAAGGVLMDERSVTLALPPDRIEPATTATVTLRWGLRQVAEEIARRLPTAPRNGSLGAANRLLVAAAGGGDPEGSRDALALLARFQKGSGGWGWWDDDPSDPWITARALRALALAKRARLPVPEAVLRRGVAGALQHYKDTNLWEHRALLAAAVTLAGGAEGSTLLEEVIRRALPSPRGGGEGGGVASPPFVSPHARLLLAEALAHAGRGEDASRLAAEIAATAVVGPATASLPAGNRPGWQATPVETTAEGLVVLLQLGLAPELHRPLAEWLARPDSPLPSGEGPGVGWRSADEEAAAARALFAYTQRHAEGPEPDTVTVEVNGTSVPLAHPSPLDPQAGTPLPHGERGAGPVRIAVPRELLRAGENRFTLRKAGAGEVFFTVEARVYRPATAESAAGLRVLRRFERRSDAATWEALQGPVRAGEVVQVTVVAWPDGRPDGIRITQPLPAGFEMVDSEAGVCAREEVRDGAVVHYLRGTDAPVSFRYYLRAEANGDLIALPAAGEVLRRPAVRGHSAAVQLEVKSGTAPP